MLYQWFELSQAAFRPARAAVDGYKMLVNNPFNPFSHTTLGRRTVAACEVFERTTRQYEKPVFGLEHCLVDGVKTSISEEIVWEKPFCRIRHFKKSAEGNASIRQQPCVLIVAPMSGHYATLLRGTVEGFIPDHDVYITDWNDASCVPLLDGSFDLDDYISYLMDMFSFFDGDVHVVAVCQPSVPVLAAISVLEAQNVSYVPHSATLMGGPIDTRINPTEVNKLAERRGTDWFKGNVITRVPWTKPGAGREVYPGFLQLTGFMTMNLDRHITAHKDLFSHLVRGDGESADKHREFYDEYLAVMDLTAEFYLQTVDTVFVKHSLPRGVMTYRDRLVDPAAIHRVAIMTVEGEKDDITGLGQTRAALDLCTGLRASAKTHYQQAGVGHYGVFNGSRFKKHILPKISAFMRKQEVRGGKKTRGGGAKISGSRSHQHPNLLQ